MLHAKAIRKYRMAKGWSVIELAKKLKHSRTSVYNYETGKQMPAPKTLQKIAKLLEVNTIDLIGEDKNDVRKTRRNIQ